jgi:hypothetical protein
LVSTPDFSGIEYVGGSDDSAGKTRPIIGLNLHPIIHTADAAQELAERLGKLSDAAKEKLPLPEPPKPETESAVTRAASWIGAQAVRISKIFTGLMPEKKYKGRHK